MKSYRTPQRTKEVRRLVENYNRARQRRINNGTFTEETAPPKMYARDIWNIVEHAENPREAYNALVGTKSREGVLRMMQPSKHPNNWKPTYNANGEVTGYRAQKRIVQKKNKFENKEREVRRNRIEKEKKQELAEKRPDSMSDEHFNELADALIDSGGNLAKQELPTEKYYVNDVNWEYDMEDGYYSIDDSLNEEIRREQLTDTVENYLAVWTELGKSPEFHSVILNVRYLQKHYPKYLLDIFNSGYDETQVSYIYSASDAAIYGKEYPKIMVNQHNRIVKFWKDKRASAQNFEFR